MTVDRPMNKWDDFVTETFIVIEKVCKWQETTGNVITSHT